MSDQPRRGPGRPTTGRTRPVLVRLTPEERAALDAAAAAGDVSSPEYARRAVLAATGR